ncbi:glutamate-rich protein 3 [Otolemur garnettii]|uniref:glutamate-rich protein 3 n=1 Tax=Otolemur garnettii TaxID=30611 RepID=UPI000C7ED966|nr:glutamate-rich protein 3 [Otolemur garnettii]
MRESRLLAAYDSLTDKHLTGYFNNTRIRRHLLRSGLITRSGRILSEREYKLNIMKRDHQKYIRECLAQAIFHKVLDMERYHQLEVKKKLETLARKERIQRFKGEHTRRFIEDNMPRLSPRPPLGPRTNRGHNVLVDEGPSSPLALTDPRPYTAPGNMQPPIRLQPLPRNPAVETVPKMTSGSRSKHSLLENTAPFPIGGRKAVMKFRNSGGNSQRMDLNRLPNISGYMMPIPPPPPPPNGRTTRENRSEAWRRRTFRPTTAPNGFQPVFARESRSIYKPSPHSNAAITMIYLGKNVHLAYDNPDFRDEIKVYQQHCGGENLCVYKGKLLEKETFQFISKRHHGFPFSLTFFLNGIQVNRLSSCCEYKHRKGSRLGGKRGYFGFVCVERSSPCYKCIIAMGLDKKPTSAKPKKEKSIEKREELKKGERRVRKDGENMTPRRNEIKGDKTCVSDIFSAQEIKTGDREVVTAMEEMERKEKPRPDVWDNDQDNTLKYDYEEDFEVEEEKQDEKDNEEGKAGERMNGTSRSPSDDEEDNLDPEKEREASSWKAPDAPDVVEEEDDGGSDSDSEEEQQGIKITSVVSFRSHRYSSSSEDESPLQDRDIHTENSTEESSRSSSPQELSENEELGQSHLLIEESLETETEDQRVTKADVETKSLPIEEDFENIREEEIERGIPEIAESLSEKSRKQASAGEKEEKSKLWEGSNSKVKDKKAGFLGVETGVGQIITEAVASGCHSHCYDDESGVSSADEEWKPWRELQIDTGGATERDSVVEERPARSSSEEPPQVAQEMSALGNRETAEEGAAPGRRAAALEEKGAAGLRGEGGVPEVPTGDGKATAEPPALAEQPPGESGVPAGPASRAQAGARRLGTQRRNPTGGAAAGDTVGLKEDEASAKQALMPTVLEPEGAASEREQAPDAAAVGNKQAAPDWKRLQEAASLRDAGTPERREAGTPERREAGTPERRREAETPERREAGTPERRREAETPERRREAETPERRRDNGEEAPADPADAGREAGTLERRREAETPERREAGTPERREAGTPERREAERAAAGREARPAEGAAGDNGEEAPADPADAGSWGDTAPRPRKGSAEAALGGERKRVARTGAPSSLSAAEAGPSGTLVPGGRPEDLCKEDAEKEDTATEPEPKTEYDEKEKLPQGLDEARERRRSGGPRTPLDEGGRAGGQEPRVGAPEGRGAAEETQELEGGKTEKEGVSEEGTNAPHNGAQSGAEKEAPVTASASSEDPGLLEDSLGERGVSVFEATAGFEKSLANVTALRKDWKVGRLMAAGDAQPRSGAGPRGGQEAAPAELRPGRGLGAAGAPAGGLGGPQPPDLHTPSQAHEPEAEDREHLASLGGRGAGERAGVVRTREDAPGAGPTTAGRLREDPGQGGASAQAPAGAREVLAGSKTAEGKATANKASSLSEVSGDETQRGEEEVPGATAETVAVEGTALSPEPQPAVQEATVTPAPEGGEGAPREQGALEGKASGQGKDQEAGTAHERGGQESGTGEESPEKQTAPGGERPQAVAAHPRKPDFAGSQEEPEHTVNGESEGAAAPLNH